MHGDNFARALYINLGSIYFDFELHGALLRSLSEKRRNPLDHDIKDTSVTHIGLVQDVKDTSVTHIGLVRDVTVRGSNADTK